MKTIHTLSAIAFGLIFALPALADWSAPVTYSEIIFGCNGTTPTLSQGLAVNLRAGANLELRAPDGAFTVKNRKIFLMDQKTKTRVEVGALAAKPTCDVEDTGEAASPSWNPISFTAGLELQLNLSTDFSSCVVDIINDGFTRNNHYTLTVNRGTGGIASVQASFQWDESAHFDSPDACQTLDQ